MGRTLYRSKTDRMLGGVAGGLAEYVGQDPTLIRLAAVLLALVTSGTIVLAYLVMWVVVPEGPVNEDGPAGKSLADRWFGQTPEPPPSPQASVAPQTVVGVGPPASSVAPAEASQPVGTETGTGSRGGRWFGIVLVLVGAAMMAERFLPRFDLFELWPIGIIVVGIFMVFTRKDG